ncbi:MAG TPA: ATP-dependent zinc metalloprotease FtsH [Pyrinomonadaceae bacterium]|jgi:cell division protease FtsH|nr:ATP-dependent zinc metalloprotease FtsH [Pyrinomonadaceae bacterium]
MISRIKKFAGRSQRALVLVALLFTIAFVFGSVSYVRYRNAQPAVQTINYSDLYRMAEGASAASVMIENDAVIVTRTDGTMVQSIVAGESFRQTVVELFRKRSVPVEFASAQPSFAATLFMYSWPALVIGLFALIGWRVHVTVNGGRGSSFKLSDQNGKQATTFADVAGVDEAKAELAETIDFLRDPLSFGRLGGRAPRGVLLYGPPGTGKTLLARAAAGEAGVPFLSVSGSSFQEKFAGVGAARVRRLFARARKLAPCIIFIDEIDALGRQRGRASDSGSADQDQTLNQLLVEMDGFDQTSSIVVIASTNRPDVLDQALTRPGRFDREIMVNLADVRGREAILKVHSRNIPLDRDLELNWIARGTPGFSGADLANLLNEAAIYATRHGQSAVARQHVEYARDKILMGAERQGFMMDEDERYATAVHEAGHVAVGLAVKNSDPIHKVSILPRGRALGVTQALPDRDRLMKKREYLEDQIAVLLGGRAAEQIVLNTMTAGASNDIERAVEIAGKMVREFGMSPLGPIYVGEKSPDQSPGLLDRIDEATNAIINTQMKRAAEVVTSERDSIHCLVELLLEHDTVEAEQIKTCFDRSLPVGDVNAHALASARI